MIDRAFLVLPRINKLIRKKQIQFILQNKTIRRTLIRNTFLLRSTIPTNRQGHNENKFKNFPLRLKTTR